LNQTYLTIAAASVAAILAMAMVFVPSLGFAKSTTATQSQMLAPKPSQITQTAFNVPGSVFDGMKLVMPASFVPVSPQQAYADSAVSMHLVALEKTIPFPKGISAADGCGSTASTASPCLPTQVIAYTFNGTIPGPIIRATVGQTIIVNITVPSVETDNHGVDNHASITNAGSFLPTAPGTSKVYSFVATQPGVWEYHCEGNVNDLAEHVFRGMHGMVIVDPAAGYSSSAKEIALDFSEYYLTNQGTSNNGVTMKNGDFNWAAMYSHSATYSYMNGIPYGYQYLAKSPNGGGANLLDPTKGNLPTPNGAIPLQFNTGDHVRFFLLNTGDWPVNFHIVGEILDQVTQGGMVQNGVQTFNLGGSNGAVVDVTFNTAGPFVIVNHDYSQLFKGQVATILVGAGGANPSNAIPPKSASGQSIHQDYQTYTFGTPLNWNGVSPLPSNQKPTGTDTTGAPYTGALPSWYTSNFP
jgi:nitrite reductase (NO-forming)